MDMKTGEELLQIVEKLAVELHPELSGTRVDLDSSLDRDLGLDSLARMELLARLEKHFGRRLSEQVLAAAETPRELLRHLAAGAEERLETPARKAVSIEPAATTADVPDRAQTLVEVLLHHAQAHPERVHIILDGSRDEPASLSYHDLLTGAGRVAAGLQHAGLTPGDTVALILPTGEDYFFSFFGVLLAGGIPVPLYPPVRPTQIEEHLRRHQAILRNAGVRFLLTVPEAGPVARLFRMRVETLETVATVAEISRPATDYAPVPLDSGDIAFLQYTSGSTGDPKGVVLTHANLLANIRAMGRATRVTPADVFVSWLPLYHDMGLIGAWLGSLYFGCRLVIMPPLSFLARPERWLQAIHHHRGTMSASPNFGYELCTRRISDSEIERLDLSSWRLAFNGAEPVTPEVIRGFCERFRACGFREEAMAPVYGLAESSVGLAFPPLGRKPLVDRVERDTFTRTGRAVPVSDPAQPALEFVACGRPLPDHEIRIVDRDGRELPERREGRLQFRGPSATGGYYRNPDKTRELFDGEWLDSGDLAYMAGGDVYVTGRVKDIVIKGGRNIYPHELEEAVGNLPGIRAGCVAVFGSRTGEGGTEKLVILAESRKKDPAAVQRLREEISNLAVDLLGMPPDEVVIAPPGSVLKTSSGKIRRAASRELYEQGGIGRPKRAVWLQVARLAAGGLLPVLRREIRRVLDVLYAGWCWTSFGLLGLVTWPMVVLLPGRRLRWHVSRIAARLLAILTGTRLRVQGLEHMPRDRAVVVAANHMSYLDALVLQAMLPIPCGYVAKAELGRRPLLRPVLGRLGVQLVERFDRARATDEAERIVSRVAGGESFLFFPEGTFQRMPGLLPFRMGAFVTAARAGVPVVPVLIRGTRSKMRGDTWFPRPGPVSVTVRPPVMPEGEGWEAAVALRDRVRAEMLAHLGEPDLADLFSPFAGLEDER
ncbi:MAG: AMP-binding protein [Desulfobulbaceae bacterium]